MNWANKIIAGMGTYSLGKYLYFYCEQNNILTEGRKNYMFSIIGLTLMWVIISSVFVDFARSRYEHVVSWIFFVLAWLNMAYNINLYQLYSWQWVNLIAVPVIIYMSVRKYRKINK